MNRTKIEWAKNPDGTPGYTWNPITGCLNHINGLCKGGGFPCYAYKLAHGRLRNKYLHGNGVLPVEEMPNHMAGFNEAGILDPFYPRFWEERLYEPVNKVRRWGRQSQVVHRQEPKGIFVCDMSDLFGIGIPEEWTRKVIDRFQYCPQHRFYLLTKQPQNLSREFPENCWVGVTATGVQMFINAGVYLQKVEAKVKFISAEPLLTWQSGTPGFMATMLQKWGINWLIIGQQTPVSAKTQPKIEWVQEIVEAADKAGIKVFLKNNLKPLLWHETERVLIPDWARMAGEYDGLGGFLLRQEMPK